MAFVQYGNQGTKEFGLVDYVTGPALKAAILKVNIKDENTNTSGGLKVMRTQVFSTDDDRADVPNVALVVTDGISTRDAEKTIPEAKNARDAGIRIYSVGVTQEIDRHEVKKIASPPEIENVTFWYLPNYSDFNSVSILQKMSETLCVPLETFTTTTPSGRY